MAQIRINFSDVQAANDGLKRTLRSMERLEEELAALQRQVDRDIQSRYGIDDRLRGCRNIAAALESRARKLHSVAAAGVRTYREAESRLSRGVPDDRKTTI